MGLGSYPPILSWFTRPPHPYPKLKRPSGHVAGRAFLYDCLFGLPFFKTGQPAEKGLCITSGKSEKDLGKDKSGILTGLAFFQECRKTKPFAFLIFLTLSFPFSSFFTLYPQPYNEAVFYAIRKNAGRTRAKGFGPCAVSDPF